MFDKVIFIYNLDNYMSDLIKNIDAKLNQIEINDLHKRNYLITKSKVRSIHSSLAIEDNSLTLSDVEKISNKKTIMGKKKEIQEVKNAIVLYENVGKFDYKSEKDFLKAHQIMMKGFEDDDGNYRNHGEGIQKNGKIIYRAPDSTLVPSLMKNLFENLDNNNINKLILASLFHYYFVSIHPFTDGNGRMARFWSTLILIEYNNNFEFIPIEEEIYLNQANYYEAIEKSHINSNANLFIKFMLEIINSSLDKIIANNNENAIKDEILELINHNKYITQNEIATKLNKSTRTVKRYFKKMQEDGILKRIGTDKTGFWSINKKD